jgi:uncharacterized protein YjaZ
VTIFLSKHKLPIKNIPEGTKVAVIQTDLWMEEHFFDPIEICKKIHQEKSTKNLGSFYNYLRDFGMYKPNRQAKSAFLELKKNKAWNTVDDLYRKYQKKWRGPDVPIYIFPMAHHFRPFVQNNRNNTNTINNQKAGLTFSDKLFLFLTPELEKKEIEALFVHEYHHIFRIKMGNKDVKDYTLLDSIVLEGLAENAVEENCGQVYLAKWCNLYSKEQIQKYWKRYLLENLSLKKDEPLHDQLLFGKRSLPDMLGYAAGYAMISTYKQKHLLPQAVTFTIKSEEFLKSEIFTMK